MRKPIIIGNWKMNGSIALIAEFSQKITPILSAIDIDCGIACPFTLLGELKHHFPSDFSVYAENMHYENNGAFTGEISPDMLMGIGIDSVIIGHSERRKYFGETDETVNLKLLKASEKGLHTIVCVGESLEERDAGKHFDVVMTMVEKAYKNISEEAAKKIVVAYEPIWAIGTGKTATAEDAEKMCKKIRSKLAELYSEEVAEEVRIQYGGSVKPSNVKEIMSMPNIDGALVGGASLKAKDFIELITFNK